MAKCCGASCACRLLGDGNHLVVTGTGTQADPFVLSADISVQPLDSPSIDMTVLGSGTSVDPWVVTAGFAITSRVGQLGDVNVPTNPTNGYVLAWDVPTQRWKAAAPTTASAGSVHTDTSLAGDGSTGTPLGIHFDPTGGLQTTASGTAMQPTILNQLVRSFTNSTDRSTITPELNTLSMLDSAPGAVDWWDGSAWQPLLQIVDVLGVETLALSGPYDGRPVQIVVKQIADVTAGDGTVDILTTGDLAPYVGLLSATFQETGPTGFKGVLQVNADNITARCYRLDDGTPYASASVSGIVTAYVY